MPQDESDLRIGDSEEADRNDRRMSMDDADVANGEGTPNDDPGDDDDPDDDDPDDDDPGESNRTGERQAEINRETESPS